MVGTLVPANVPKRADPLMPGSLMTLYPTFTPWTWRPEEGLMFWGMVGVALVCWLGWIVICDDAVCGVGTEVSGCPGEAFGDC